MDDCTMTSALPPLVQACSGALGSATANAVSYPLDLVATKLQISTRRGVQGLDRKSTRLNSSHSGESRMPSSA